MFILHINVGNLMIDFNRFPKIARLSREIVITEKIDGTNSSIYISEDLSPITLESGRVVPFLCGSRTRWIFPENDNHGFARWAYEHIDELMKLGKGQHFGEWWGQGIQRNYGLTEKKFSLFNVHKWYDFNVRPSCCDVVPILYQGIFDSNIIDEQLDMLKLTGSIVVKGFMKPEGIVIYHTHGNIYFKKTIEGDSGKHEEIDKN